MRPRRPKQYCQRNILWFNPPYSQNVETKVGKSFIQLIDQHFPKSNPLHKIFNRNTVKLSYSCMSNVKKTLSPATTKPKLTNHQSNQTKAITVVIAAKRTPVHLREIATSGTLYTKQRSRLHRQKKHTLDCVTQHSRNATETMYVLSRTSATKM